VLSTEQTRVTKHPILPVPERKTISFTFNDKMMTAYEGEVISSALFANGITVFGHHYLDDSPLGIFCANGQCSQCMVIADGLAVKACMTFIKPGMKVYSCDGLPELPRENDIVSHFDKIETRECEVLIIGGGPSGIAAAIELGKLGHSVILVDDKDQLGGKLVLQTHTFFGSIDDCHAGTRGIDIARILKEELDQQKSVEVCLNATAIGVFCDKKIGVLQEDKYFLVEPKALLIAAGARERALTFPGWNLPGVYGAGAFQTLLNRDLVKPSDRLFVVGGGNVGLIAAYHAMQAGISVIGLAEALPKVSGYKVHADKVKRLGLPLYLSNSILRADGDDKGVKSVTIAEVDSKFQTIPGTEKTFEVDTVLIAVGLTPITELYDAAKDAGIKVYSAGDAKEIAEASAAMFGGKIAGLTIASDFGDKVEVPSSWYEKEEILKSKPGDIKQRDKIEKSEGVFPVFHCTQEIPCNPCIEVCPKEGIKIPGNSLMGIPQFSGECISCFKCVAICPGLAITLVDFRKAEPGLAHVTVPFELLTDSFKIGDSLPALDVDGNFLADTKIVNIRSPKFADRTSLVTLEVPAELAVKVAGVQIQPETLTKPVTGKDCCKSHSDEKEDLIICSCMRVKESEIRKQIREGVRDLNQLKADLHAGMGACNGKTCEQLIMRVFREEGVKLDEIVPFVKRLPIMEVSLGVFAGVNK
jgi:NADPH-dependent 2,4-dienoyl-CoA reductase/sulfur reductase-like enzyme/Fe-S-cluster-containing hydrogenase component 2/bacterioferritin-associated ferredoxin